jgi:hypothetical protein
MLKNALLGGMLGVGLLFGVCCTHKAVDKVVGKLAE